MRNAESCFMICFVRGAAFSLTFIHCRQVGALSRGDVPRRQGQCRIRKNTWALCGCKTKPCTGARRRLRRYTGRILARLRRVQAFGGDVQDEALRGRGLYHRQTLVNFP